MARILLATPEGQQVVELRDFNSMGRHPSNTIQLLDKIVSKEHCVIERRGPVFWLKDLGSLNGTYVNGERVQGERELRHGDDMALGGTRARYDDGSGRPMPALPGYPGGFAATPQQGGWQQQPNQPPQGGGFGGFQP
ncbi:MAG TPA: FHA domain-containing protein, partial [Polyangiaceae bacterium]|nr:FHA domain-containing protein [Polyangiaceae bacterium]